MGVKEKYRDYRQLCDALVERQTASHGRWTRYLDTAAFTYRAYSFEDQVLIGAQRPDARGVATYDQWNGHYNRGIKRGTKGIVLLAPGGSVKHVFDISDTWRKRGADRAQLWRFKREHAALFGEGKFSAYLAELVKEHAAAYNMDSGLQAALESSAMYAALVRLNANPDKYVDYNSFKALASLETLADKKEFGAAVSTVIGQVLRTIEETVKTHERSKADEHGRGNRKGQDRPLRRRGGDDVGRGVGGAEPVLRPRRPDAMGGTASRVEASDGASGRERVRDGGGDTGNPDGILHGADGRPWDVREGQEGLPETLRPGSVLGAPTGHGGVLQISGDGGGREQGEGEPPDRPDSGSGRRDNGAAQELGHDEVGRADEQRGGVGAGDGHTPAQPVTAENFLEIAAEGLREPLPAGRGTSRGNQETLAAPAREAAPKANFRITDDRLGEGGAKEKYQYNIAAIKTLQGIEREGRAATPGEQETLSRYVGWGGMPQAFDGGNEKWSAEHQELKSLLSPAEYESARASALNAYYTAPTVIRAMYETLGRMGFSDGSLLEPSCGVGNFLGLVPESMARAELHGVELDSITGRIAVQLYQDADIQVKGYEKTSFADNQFDVAIGNVPFGSYQVADGRYSKHGFHIHDYFFAKTLDKVRPGGIVAFVTSKGTLDKANPKARKYMAERAELLGAVRLPNNAFLKNAGTEVTSDIVFLQKRESPIAVEPDWVHLGKTPDGIPINSYFADNPHMVLGAMSLGKGMYGNATETTCNPIPGADLREQLKDALANIQGRIAGRGLAASDIGKDGGRLPADPDVRDYSYTLAGGAVYYREGGFMDPVKASADTLARCKSMIGLEEAVRGLIAAQLDGLPDGAVNGKQAELNALYDGFVAKHGLINTPANKKAFDGDSAFFLLASLEEKDKDGNTRKADIFTKRTVTPNTEVTAAGTASEALAISIGQLARVDMGYMQALTGFSEEKLAADLQGVVYRDLGAYRPDYGSYKQKYPTEAQISEEIRAQIGPETYDIAAKPYVTAEEYLSGNVRQKLRVAKELAASRPDLAGMVAPNIAALEQVQPTELEAADITANLGATWIHKDYVQQFVVDTLGLPPPRRYGKNLHTVSYSETTGSWNIADKANSYGSTNTLLTETYGTKRVNAFKIIEETLNLKDVRVFDRTADDRSVLNQKETELAQQRQEKIKREFREWLFKDPARRQSLCSYYNDIYNSARLRAYDGSHIAFGGINPEIGLKRHQTGAIARIIYNGNTLLAHEVGAGKTFEMIAAAMEMKRLGLCGKSLFVVPNHITEQTAAEFMRLYPAANILVATEKDFSADNRKKFCARVATGDYDAVIIGHSQFEKIPVSKERQAAFIEDQIFEIVRGIDELRRERGDKFTIKEMERTKKSLEAKLSKLINDGRKDDVVTFEELGIDRLFVDEAHYYKNLQMYTKMRNVAGLSQGEAQKSTDMFMKCRYMDEKTGGKGVVFATGTPISNSMIEMYTMKKYLYFDKLTEKGFAHFDSWASTFGEAVTANEISPDGGYRSKTRFSRFQGLPELMGMFNEFADIKTADTLQLPRPEARFHTVAVKPTEHQKELVKALSERAKAVHEKRVDPTVDNMLKITTDGRKTGLDQRLIDENLPDDPASKVNACKDNIFRIWEETKGDRLAQLVFCDFSTPGKGRFNLYDDIKNKLVAKGIPESEIAFIHDADTKEKKAAMFDKVRSGEIRVMFGSTAKCGSGTNVQDRLVALHDLDCPWRPADLEQRAGRIIRQGNRNREVDIYRYVTEATFDAYLFQTIENKQKFISQIMTSKSPARVCEDVDEQVLSYAEIKALCAGNPLIKEKIDLESEVGKLKMLKAEHRNQQYRMQDRKLTALPQAIEACRQTVRNLEADLATVAANTRKEESGISPMVINGAAYTSRADAGAALMAACKGMDRGDNAASAVIGSYRGLEMRLSFDFFKTEWKITLKGGHSHEAALGSDASGNVARIDNAIGGIADRLGDSKTRLSLLEKEMGDIDVMLERPFEFEGKLAEKTERLAEVEALLCQDSEKQGNDGQDPAAHGGQDGAGRFSMDGVKRDIAEITGNRAKSGYAAGFQQAQNVR